MRGLAFITGVVLLCGPILSAQSGADPGAAAQGTAGQQEAWGKVAAQWHCPAESVSHKLEVGDVPDHSYVISQGTCSISSKDGGLPEKSAAFTEFDETWKDSYKFHGRANVTLENGDKVFYSYEGSAKDASKPPVENWKLTGGTGKYTAIKGSGSCAGKTNSDGTSDWNCTGTYSLGK
jgi:hypothetical protein